MGGQQRCHSHSLTLLIQLGSMMAGDSLCASFGWTGVVDEFQGQDRHRLTVLRTPYSQSRKYAGTIVGFLGTEKGATLFGSGGGRRETRFRTGREEYGSHIAEAANQRLLCIRAIHNLMLQEEN